MVLFLTQFLKVSLVAIINGEKYSGVTTFFIDEKIDTGAIILQSKLTIEPSENAGSLHDKLMHLGSKLVIETIQQIEVGFVETHTQSIGLYLMI